MRKNNFMNKIIKLKGSILAGIIQIFACLIVYKFNIPNPNIVLFVVLSASIVQSGYLAGIISGVIAVLYSAFFFSTDHSWIFYTPINRDKLCVIVLGVISNIILVGNLQEANRQAEHKIAKLESEKKQKKKELEQQDELHKALIAADTANRAKSTFLLNMSHDIRTPLNGIMGLLKINMAHSDDEELVRENYKEMEKAANHMLSLINDVLQMSKLEDGREELSLELVCLPDVFCDMKAIIDGSALDKGISVDFSEDSIWVHPYVITNPLYLRQIFLNTGFFQSHITDQFEILFAGTDPACDLRKFITLLQTFVNSIPVFFAVQEKFALTDLSFRTSKPMHIIIDTYDLFGCVRCT